jgi:hypothetical protein
MSLFFEWVVMKNNSIRIRSHFKETQAAELPPLKEIPKAGNKFKVILIEEGLGNLGDCFYYTKGALQNAAQLFEGKKCFADHPSSLEEKVRPERSTRDILGHFENVKYEESDGRGCLYADLVVLTNPSFAWAQTLLSTAIGYGAKFQDSDFVGLSINASGEANEIPLEDFMKEAEIPASVLPKLQNAQSQGIPLIRVVTQLKDAVSCDLVTEAGAGGKILQMIEQRKNPMKKHEAKKEAKHEAVEASEKHESKAHEAEGVEGQKTDGAAPDHEDEDQDKALIAKMIHQYLGDDADSEDAETHEMAKHAYEAHKEAGMEGQEAYEAAGHHLKMSMVIGKKMHQKQSESEAHESEAESHEAGDVGAGPEMSKKGKGLPSSHGMPPTSGTSHAGPAKESTGNYKAKFIQALGEVARLKEALKKYELASYLDKKLSESKRAVSITKTFREALGAPKSKEQIDHAYKLFMTGADVGSEAADSFESFVFTEKTGFKESDAGTEGSFSDCMES